MLVDFGAAVTNKDDVKLVKQGRWDRQVDWGRTAATQRVLVVAEWQDVYAVFQIAKFLCLAFMPAAATGGDLKGRPENVACMFPSLSSLRPLLFFFLFFFLSVVYC